MSERGFFSRILGGGVEEDETSIFSDEEIGARRSARREPEEEQRPQGFTVERAAEIIDDLPPDVPRESAVRIVRDTLTATGIRIDDLERSTRVRESKLKSEMELARNRQEGLRERTEEVIRSLEEEIRKAREARDTGITEEEERISRASVGIEGIKRVRAFFGFAEAEESTGTAGDLPVDETQALEPFDADETRVLRRGGSLAETDEPADTMTSESPSQYRNPHDPSDER